MSTKIRPRVSRLACWLTDWPTGWWTDWVTDWLTYELTVERRRESEPDFFKEVPREHPLAGVGSRGSEYSLLRAHNMRRVTDIDATTPHWKCSRCLVSSGQTQ